MISMAGLLKDYDLVRKEKNKRFPSLQGFRPLSYS